MSSLEIIHVRLVRRAACKTIVKLQSNDCRFGFESIDIIVWVTVHRWTGIRCNIGEYVRNMVSFHYFGMHTVSGGSVHLFGRYFIILNCRISDIRCSSNNNRNGNYRRPRRRARLQTRNAAKVHGFAFETTPKIPFIH